MNYHLDLRERVINWVLNGNSRLSASQVFKVHYNTVKAWVTNDKNTGEYTALPRYQVWREETIWQATI